MKFHYSNKFELFSSKFAYSFQIYYYKTHYSFRITQLLTLKMSAIQVVDFFILSLTVFNSSNVQHTIIFIVTLKNDEISLIILKNNINHRIAKFPLPPKKHQLLLFFYFFQTSRKIFSKFSLFESFNINLKIFSCQRRHS